MPELTLQIVVIDDDPSDIFLMQRFLEGIEDWDVDVVAHHDATSGTADLALRHPDVVILDHMLGADTGLQVIEQIRDVGYAGPIIFLTGRGDEEVAVQAWKAGVDDYLPKRVLSTSSLKRTISNCLEKHKLRAAIEVQRRKTQKTNERLTKTTEELRTFYHAVSHELKTPLTSAREFTSILLDEVAGPINEAQKQYLQLSLEGLDQMTHYINDLLDSTRMETGKLKIDPKPTSLAKIVQHVVSNLALRASDKNLDLSLDIANDLPLVSADHHRITQVVSNLVGNAIKFTPEGGAVTVYARVDPNEPGDVQVSVADTGCGIANEHLGRVFDRLYQVDRTTADGSGGLGLGLNICKGIVGLHGGTIWVDSEPGRGSTFNFTIPAQVSPELVNS